MPAAREQPIVTDASPASAVPFDHHRGSHPLLWKTGSFRGFFFVAANLVVFVAANAFLHYLATGQWLEFSRASYRRAAVSPLSDMLLAPLSIFALPWMIVVTGLLVGAVAFVPIIVAVLYRLWVSVLFVLAVALVGHAPLLAASLAAGCVVAAVTRLRSDLPFLALLTGLVAATGLYAVCYHLFGPGPAKLLLPLERLALAFPFILAGVAAVVAGGMVVALARWTNFRPGVVWPALLMLTAAPVALFYRYVSPAELEYGEIAGALRPGGPLLSAGAPVPTGTRADAERAALRRRRRELLDRCERFLERHGSHRRAPVVLWIKAAVLAAEGDPAAQGAWGGLTERHRGSPQATVAHYRLGVEALREQRVERAAEHLRTAQSELIRHLRDAGAPERGLWASVFAPRRPLPGRDYCRRTLSRVDRVLWLMVVNKVTEPGPEHAQTVRAFAEYMERWPFERPRQQELLELAAAAEKTPLADNFRLQAALAEPDLMGRAWELSGLAEELNDGAIVANYELGRLALRLGGERAWAEADLKGPADYFKVVVNAPDNPYRGPAERHLAWLAHREAVVATAPPTEAHECVER